MNTTPLSVCPSETQQLPAVDQKPSFFARHPRIGKVAVRVGEFAKCFFKFLIGFGLFYVNPSLFFIGVIGGVIFDKQADKIVQKIKLILEKQPWYGKALIIGICALEAAVTLGAGSILFGAALGSRLSLSAVEDEKFEKTPAAANG